VAAARRRADEERRQAEQAWAERQKQLAKDRAARLAAIEQHHRELDETREQRRAEREREIRAKWDAAFLADADTQAELTLHAQRTAELARMREVAELSGNGKLVVRIGVAQSREDDRHQARMTALHDSLGRKP
jgi:23S rRNA pseudoU1915 N3-methylase RlmH